jgi:hypothetical protein
MPLPDDKSMAFHDRFRDEKSHLRIVFRADAAGFQVAEGAVSLHWQSCSREQVPIILPRWRRPQRFWWFNDRVLNKGDDEMQSDSSGATAVLTEMVKARRFEELSEAWREFLEYLKSRRWSDLRGCDRAQTREVLERWLKEGVPAKSGGSDDPDSKWRNDFDQREDVIKAVEDFRRLRG